MSVFLLILIFIMGPLSLILFDDRLDYAPTIILAIYFIWLGYYQSKHKDYFLDIAKITGGFVFKSYHWYLAALISIVISVILFI